MRVLIHEGKDPFTPVAPESVVVQNVVNRNLGNMLFGHSVHRTLGVDGTELVASGTLSEFREATDEDRARVNDEFDAFVVPVANYLRPGMSRRLNNLASLVEGLTIPVVVVGIGAQAPASGDMTALSDVRAAAKRLVSAVLDHSASVGVRGAFTRQFLLDCGFADTDVEVIGCPSLFMNGRDHRVAEPLGDLHTDAPVAMNLTPAVAGSGATAVYNAARYANLTYLAQDDSDMRLLMWGRPRRNISDPDVPAHMGHRLYQEDRIRLFLDTWPWIEFMGTQQFSFGSRFHGNVAALLAGTPAMLLAHDARTIELAEYHRVPYRMARDDADDAATLYTAVDVGPFNEAMPGLFDTFVGFLERNGLHHIYQPDTSSADFDARLAETEFPEALRPLTAPDGSQVAARLAWLKEAAVFDSRSHSMAYRPPYPFPPRGDAGSRRRQADERARRRMDRLERELDALSGENDELAQRLKALEEHLGGSI